MGWLGSLRSTRSRGRGPPGLEELIKPYREAIVATSTPPPTNRVEVSTWQDVIRTSDTLGKPILRYSSKPGANGSLFYVLDGTTGYVYEHGHLRIVESNAGPSAEAPVPAGVIHRSPLVPSTVPSTPPENGGQQPRPSAGLVPEQAPTAERALRDRARRLLERIEATPVGRPSKSNAALLELRRAVADIRNGRSEDAERRLDVVDRLLDG